MENVIVKKEKELEIRPSIDQIFYNLDQLGFYLRSEIMERDDEFTSLNFQEAAFEYFENRDAIWYLKENDSQYINDGKCYLKIVLSNCYSDNMTLDFLNQIITENEIIYKETVVSIEKYNDDI